MSTGDGAARASRSLNGSTSSVGSNNSGEASTVASGNSKERVLARIKHNFYLETQSFKQRVNDATEEAARAKEKVDALQESVIKWKKRCAKLQHRLEEKDEAMARLQQRHDVQFPLLFDETLRSVQTHMDNQSDDLGSITPLSSHSVVSRKPRSGVDADDRVHEYEQQVAALYEELDQEKQRTTMLNECLQEQKSEKYKYMKASKRLKQELQAVKDSGLSQMLADMEAKCALLEQEKQCLTESLQQEQAKVRGQEEERDELLDKIGQIQNQLAQSQDGIEAKDADIHRLRNQIRDQQIAMENLQADLQESRHRLTHSENNTAAHLEEKLGIATHSLRIEQNRSKTLETELSQVKNLNAQLLRSLEEISNQKVGGEDLVQGCSCSTAFQSLYSRTREINRKLRALLRVLDYYAETETVDMSLLDDLRWPNEQDTTSFRGTDTLSFSKRELEEAEMLVDRIQHSTEELLARAMGSACALQ